MSFAQSDLSAMFLTVKLASTVTIILLIIGTPIAWWLSKTNSIFKGFINSLIALPLVLPPTVLGFYCLILMSPKGLIGQITNYIGLGSLTFTFWGLVVASVFYSLPFVVQPIQNSFETIGTRPLEIAATAGSSPLDTFMTVVLPLAKPGFLTAAILGFVHTVGEFGVVLMIGGNIPGETQVVSVQIYEHVEALDYSTAHSLSMVMVLFSFTVLLVLNYLQRSNKTTLF
ncbi:MAG: molybdate ABC transporter permease subunit [Candidatus Cloacimonadota bacterium]|nr:MAG: molybdate ABC transporter permease subunit [Candidatus Cloacimonadota bacterium]